MKRYQKEFKENIVSELEYKFRDLFKQHSAKDAAGLLKIALIDALPGEEYTKDFMRIFR
jgi:hypothetical protein